MPADHDLLVLSILTLILVAALASAAAKAAGKLLLRRFGRSWRDAYRDLRVRTNRFKLTEKARIVEDLMRDREVLDAIVDHTRETGESLTQAERRVRTYLDEIIPAFDLVSYYRVGLPIARFALAALYRLVVWKEDLGDSKRLHAENAVVYIFNHRSNADYIFAAFALTDRVALSYAVGEWARVWPLEGLFKSFGSYFVRRGEKERLYHRVLGRYVQVVTQRGVPQGIFLEGGLSRDGWLREPKVGLLDHILQCAKDPAFGRDIVFVPGGLNYDRVLEDRALTAEAHGRRPEKSILRMFKRTLRILFRGSITLALRRARKHGHAALRLGRPISFREYVRENGREVLDLGREARAPHVKRFAGRIMEEVARLMPVAAVPLVSLALVDEREAVRDAEVVERVRRLRGELERAGARLVRPERSTEELCADAVVLMETRGTLRREADGRLRVSEADREIFRYYARSIAHFLPGVLGEVSAGGGAPGSGLKDRPVATLDPGA
jgi:glycerol-3-phosphate O-acyltransferase